MRSMPRSENTSRVLVDELRVFFMVAPSSLTSPWALFLHSVFCSGVDRVANRAPRSKVTFVDPVPALASSSIR